MGSHLKERMQQMVTTASQQVQMMKHLVEGGVGDNTSLPDASEVVQIMKEIVEGGVGDTSLPAAGALTQGSRVFAHESEEHAKSARAEMMYIDGERLQDDNVAADRSRAGAEYWSSINPATDAVHQGLLLAVEDDELVSTDKDDTRTLDRPEAIDSRTLHGAEAIDSISRQSFARDASVTGIMRNIPNAYSRDYLLNLFDLHGFSGAYNMVYLPTDFLQEANLGYCFINFVNRAAFDSFREIFQGFSKWHSLSEKVCDVVESTVQGLTYHLQRYRNHSVMHETVPGRFRPALFEDGQRVAFPAPTQRIRPPRAFRARQP